MAEGVDSQSLELVRTVLTTLDDRIIELSKYGYNLVGTPKNLARYDGAYIQEREMDFSKDGDVITGIIPRGAVKLLDSFEIEVIFSTKGAPNTVANLSAVYNKNDTTAVVLDRKRSYLNEQQLLVDPQPFYIFDPSGMIRSYSVVPLNLNQDPYRNFRFNYGAAKADLILRLMGQKSDKLNYEDMDNTFFHPQLVSFATKDNQALLKKYPLTSANNIYRYTFKLDTPMTQKGMISDSQFTVILNLYTGIEAIKRCYKKNPIETTTAEGLSDAVAGITIESIKMHWKQIDATATVSNIVRDFRNTLTLSRPVTSYLYPIYQSKNISGATSTASPITLEQQNLDEVPRFATIHFHRKRGTKPSSVTYTKYSEDMPGVFYNSLFKPDKIGNPNLSDLDLDVEVSITSPFTLTIRRDKIVFVNGGSKDALACYKDLLKANKRNSFVCGNNVNELSVSQYLEQLPFVCFALDNAPMDTYLVNSPNDKYTIQTTVNFNNAIEQTNDLEMVVIYWVQRSITARPDGFVNSRGIPPYSKASSYGVQAATSLARENPGVARALIAIRNAQ